MKKIFAFLLLFCMPIVSLGLDDACTKPDEFTTDKRCYVVNVSPSYIKPYSAVVALVDEDGDNYCTGTIVKFGKNFYVITAKHCTYNKSKLTAVTYNDDIKLDLDKVVVGYDHNDDWAVYHIRNGNDVGDRFINITNLGKSPIGWYNARVIGYGALKIMSDKEIDDFKQKYIDYLEKIDPLEVYKSGDSIYIDKEFVYDFLSDNDYFFDTFYNTGWLKVSKCIYYENGQYVGCQTWGGNSGGPVVDKNGDLMAIHYGGFSFIGGKGHAVGNASVNLLGLRVYLKMLERTSSW